MDIPSAAFVIGKPSLFPPAGDNSDDRNVLERASPASRNSSVELLGSFLRRREFRIVFVLQTQRSYGFLIRFGLFLLQDQFENLSLHTQKGIEFLERYGHFIRDRCAIEVEYAAKLR